MNSFAYQGGKRVGAVLCLAFSPASLLPFIGDRLRPITLGPEGLCTLSAHNAHTEHLNRTAKR